MGIIEIAAWLTAIAAGLAAIAYIVRSVSRALRRVGHFLDDWFGEPARDDQPARPGVMARLGRIENRQARTEQRVGSMESELKPNGGGSMKDQVTRIEQATGADQQL